MLRRIHGQKVVEMALDVLERSGRARVRAAIDSGGDGARRASGDHSGIELLGSSGTAQLASLARQRVGGLGELLSCQYSLRERRLEAAYIVIIGVDHPIGRVDGCLHERHQLCHNLRTSAV
jgi:hypothetical protein